MGWAYNIAIAVAVVAGSALSGPLAFDVRAAGGPIVGMVTKVENQAQIDGQPAAVGSPVHTNDTVTSLRPDASNSRSGEGLAAGAGGFGASTSGIYGPQFLSAQPASP